MLVIGVSFVGYWQSLEPSALLNWFAAKADRNVARSRYEGAPRLRRSMYLPYVTGPYEPKSDDSPTPLYHRLGGSMRGRRGAM